MLYLYHLCDSIYCLSYCKRTVEAKQSYKTEKKLRCMNEPNCTLTAQVWRMRCTLSCTSCMYFGFCFTPPGSVSWWGLPRRTPPSLALWRPGLYTTAPGLDSLTAADRYLLTIPVSTLTAFLVFYSYHGSKWIHDRAPGVKKKNMLKGFVLSQDVGWNKFTVIFGQNVRCRQQYLCFRSILVNNRDEI